MADAVCNAESHVSRFNEVPLCLASLVSPDASKGNRLAAQRGPANCWPRPYPWHAPAALLQHTQQVLHMVTNLEAKHIGLRELAGLTADLAGDQTPFEVLKEARVEVNLLDEWALDRPHRRDFGNPQPDCVALENMTNAVAS